MTCWQFHIEDFNPIAALLISSRTTGLGMQQWEEQSAVERDSEIAATVYDDPSRFLEIYNSYYTRILNYLYRRTRDRDVALDLVSATFLRAYSALTTARHRELAVRPWLYRLATNVHLDACRAEKRWLARVPLLGEWFGRQAAPRHDHVLLEKGEAERVRVALQALHERYRAPLVLRYYEHLSYAEIAAALGIREASARSRVSRGLQLLKRAMDAGND
jgi:RNA polymerase sigma-70 factor (ECF subfamily)